MSMYDLKIRKAKKNTKYDRGYFLNSKNEQMKEAI